MSTAPASAMPGSEPAPPDTLASLRAELDDIDAALHDLLMRRAAVVERVAALKGGGIALRPGREAQIIRRLLARHAGHLPAHSLVRIWRELLAGTCAIQGNFAIAVCDSEQDGGLVQLAREQFGALTPLRQHRSPAQALAEVSAGSVALAVLPMPAEEEPVSAAWWRALLHRDEPRIHIVARLPFWTRRPEGASRAPALVAAAVAPDPSGDDRSLLGLELSPDMSRARLAAALTTAGFGAAQVLLRRDGGSALALVDVPGWVGDDDPRLALITPLLRPVVVLGAYAVPTGGDPS